jgi:two-component system catabolic regulation response regulator CreB
MRCAHHSLGRNGLAALQREPFDLLILDIGLPDGNGFDFCRSLRLTSTIPIIFLTARSDEIDRAVGLEMGADDYVLKPFSPRELAARVKSVLRRMRSATAPHVESALPPQPPSSDWLQVDEERACIRCAGESLALSRAEYLILKAMAARPGRVFSRSELMDAAQLAEASLERTVDSHIKSVRAKLSACAAGADPIQTHRGMGYSLCLPIRP